LAKVIEYCKFHTETHTDDEKKNFDTDFVKVDQATLFELILVRRSLRPARYRE
jgi:S-phase kinase-associated protein 1